MSFTDHRGSIRDLLVEPLDSVTEIFTLPRKIRGNHYHRQTTQWTYVVSGSLRLVTPDCDKTLYSGELWRDEPGTPHAWEALERTVCLVFTRGPRSGSGYEDDTIRLDTPLI